MRGREERSVGMFSYVGLEAGDASEEGAALAEAIEARLRTGRPLGDAAWIARAEAALSRPLMPAKRGPKVKRAGP